MEKSAQIFCILEGILMAIVGILFFIKPMDSLLYFTIVAGILIIGSGIFTIIKAFKSSRKGLYIFTGIISVLFGLMLCFVPLESIDVLVIFYGSWALVNGIFLLFGEFTYKSFGFNATTLYSILLIILGLLILFEPISFLIATPFIIGIYFIIIAVFEIYLGFKL
ncbi:TPA: DUF308 domain-containing protein [Clostridium perfringens]|uniref:DUF308 domain-containing protein n=1 Tax=Clostridium perfringens TaxID=1502 RepID=UPI0018996883|nr:DUF308 domain-containing protein [Clostridium perfringens]MDM0608179.1 DUF308 domain-containing protein [Clostridium perfringens]MDM0626372.1 DUF308 domain-containing protein [Clostridium perfringens]